MFAAQEVPAIAALKRIADTAIATSSEEAERVTREHLTQLWQEREQREAAREPSLVEIPRFYVPKSKSMAMAPAASASTQQVLQAKLSQLARTRLRDHLASLILDSQALERLWQLLRQHASPPRSASDERINYDDFCQVGEAMPARCRRTLFSAAHFLKFRPDSHGRISLLHFFQWTRRKNSLMQTRAELSMFDASGDGWLTERELEQWVGTLIPTLPALSDLREEFFPFYKVTAVRKFLFFLDPRRRGRVQIKAMLASPVTHELLELRRTDIQPDELRHNWFSLLYAEMLYADYLELDTDQYAQLSPCLRPCRRLQPCRRAAAVPSGPCRCVLHVAPPCSSLAGWLSLPTWSYLVLLGLLC